MKLSITDQFLLNIYNLLERIDKSTEKIISPRSIHELIYPDFHRLKREYKRRQAKRTFSQFINYLKEKGYIEINNLKEKRGIILTPKGFDKVIDSKFKIQKLNKRSDGKWQMIIFDIPEKKRHLRNLLREKLCLLGHKLLQQSVWVSPYDIYQETEKFLREYSLDQYVRIFLIEEVT